MGKTDLQMDFITEVRAKYVEIIPVITTMSFINIDINNKQEHVSIVFHISIINVNIKF